MPSKAEYTPAENAPRHTKKIHFHNCDNCGGEIQLKQKLDPKRKRKFCSKECYSHFCSENRAGENNPNFKGKLKTCPNCGLEFSNRFKVKYCSRSCYFDHFKRENLWTIPDRHRENNPNWMGGSTEELAKIRASPEYAAWRTAVFTRDNYSCQECDSGSNKLHAHHIKPFHQFPKLRLSVDNGVTLCEDCHKKKHEDDRGNGKPVLDTYTGVYYETVKEAASHFGLTPAGLRSRINRNTFGFGDRYIITSHK